MDRRSWPWKKKSEKAVVLTDSVSASLPNSSEIQTEKDDTENEKYMQIKIESYTHFTGLEDQVKTLTEKLFYAESEITAKGNLVKQHTKVAEEAVSGWEKAEAEASSLKQQLESITLLKLTAEERALHLDNALKECMKQIRNVKEESEQKLYDAIFTRTKQWEKVKADLEARIIVFEEELQNASAENSGLSSSLQEKSSRLKRVSDEKFEADAEIEVLKKDIQSCEKEISSLKYELHVIFKELEIRNEEKNMCMRSAEVANKHHLEDVKKITKLESECQRLRGLVRKKLPGPAALAQMKLEVKSLGRESGESRLRRSSLSNSSPHHIVSSDITLENIQQVRKENEFLTTRLLAMEEEMKLLNEILVTRNSELHASRNMCSKQGKILCSMKSHMTVLNQQRSSLTTNEFTFGNECNPPSWTSLSDDGFDESGSFSESCSTALVSENSHSKKARDFDKIKTAEMELMDDFLEMERLACLSTKRNGDFNMSNNLETDKVEANSLCHSETVEHVSIDKDLPLLVLKSKITSIVESKSHGVTAKQIIEDIRHIIQDSEKELLKDKIESMDYLTEQEHCHNYTHENTDDRISSKKDGNLCTKVICLLDQELKDAISHINEFVLSLGKDDTETVDCSNDLLRIEKKIEGFSSVSVDMCNEVSLHDFILALSRKLSETSAFRYKDNVGENCSDFIDKEALLENGVSQLEESPSGAPLVANSPSPNFKESIGCGFQVKTNLPILSLEDFDNLKIEKEKMEMDLIKCQEMLGQTNFTLIQTEQKLLELKSELASCQKSNSLAETQLKCMVESYKILELQKEELEAEIRLLHAKAETLYNELQEERDSHQEYIAKYKELQEQIERNMKFAACALPSNADDVNAKQEIDIAAAEEKLAECQETIFLVGKQLQAMRNPTEPPDASPNHRLQRDDVLVDEADLGLSNSRRTFGFLLSDQGEKTAHSVGEPPLIGHNSHPVPSNSECTPFSISPISTKHQKQKTYGSSPSSSTSSSSVSDKQGRVFTRFFSKPKIEKAGHLTAAERAKQEPGRLRSSRMPGCLLQRRSAQSGPLIKNKAGPPRRQGSSTPSTLGHIGWSQFHCQPQSCFLC
ncbi:Filament-like plant protein 4 [Platanthera guangdongensis]|uniref:Filament-like plant protein 4 n=1 Tax=Platanthera guangdongensis TaxID=2320717 RepID=A0ABR2LQP3_9ASPA